MSIAVSSYASSLCLCFLVVTTIITILASKIVGLETRTTYNAIDLRVTVMKSTNGVITIRLRYDYDPTTTYIALACFHSTRFDASKK